MNTEFPAQLFHQLIASFARLEHNQRANPQTVPRFAVLAVLATIAILCKETGITVLPMCAVYDVLRNTNVTNVFRQRRPIKSVIGNDGTHLFVCRLTFAVAVTSALVYGRLWVVNFEQPKFKTMDNPIAAADSQLTKVVN